MRRLLFFLPLFPLLGLLACDATSIPQLIHLKRPIASVVVNTTSTMCSLLPGDLDGAFCRQDDQCPEGRQCIPQQRRLMYVVNADIDRLTAIDLDGIGFPFVLEARNFSLPGIMYLRTGRYPIDIAVHPNQRRMYVLHGIDGDIGVWDTEKRAAVIDDGKILRFPRGCEAQRSCWPSPKQLLLVPQGDRLLGFILLPTLPAIAVINLTEGEANYGEEIQRIPLSGTPTRILHDTAKERLYITNGSEPILHQIALNDLNNLTARSFFIGTLTSDGAISPDGAFAYLIDIGDGGILLLDLATRKAILQGDPRFPEERNIYPPDRNAQFTSIRFLPRLAEYRTRNKSGIFAWATASDGIGYLIDAFHHRLFYEAPQATVTPAVLTIDGRTPNRGDMPGILDDKIEVFSGQTRDELWRITFEGRVIEPRWGEFEDIHAGRFTDKELDLQSEGVQVGDQLVLLEERGINSCKCHVLSLFPDPTSDEALKRCEHLLGQSCRLTLCTANTTDEELERIDCPIRNLPIREVDGHKIRVEITSPLSPPARWRYNIRAVQAYTAFGSVSGLLPARIKEGEPFANDFFALAIREGIETPQDTRFEFTTQSGIQHLFSSLLGIPSHTLLAEDRYCQRQNGCLRLWMLDSHNNRAMHIQINQSLQISSRGTLQ